MAKLTSRQLKKLQEKHDKQMINKSKQAKKLTSAIVIITNKK